MTLATSDGAAKRPAGIDCLYWACCVFGQLGRHVGLDEARGDDVGGDVAAAELARDRAGHADEAGLRRGVVDLAGAAEQADDARDQDDAAELGLQHALRRALDDAERAAEVGVDDVGEVLLRHPQQQRVARDARVGDDDLDRSELLLDLGEGRIDRGGVGHIRADGERTIRSLAAAGGHRDTVALGDELFGDRVADAAIATGDEDGARGHDPTA